MSCPACGATVGAIDQFCESCGASLVEVGDGVATLMADAPPATTGELSAVDQSTGAIAAVSGSGPKPCSCGGAIDADGWCTVCGLRGPSERDHFTEQPAPNVAAVCDKGLVHGRNEDAVALAATDGRVVMVVCDGVTSSTDSDVASMASARAARDVLAGTDPSDAPPNARADRWMDALKQATGAAQDAAVAAAAAVGARENPPSCTFVAAVVDGSTLVAGWLGDSRCYWFGEDGESLQVSVDDSWATEQIARGIDRKDAERDPRAHGITRWLGVDAPTRVPSSTSISVAAGGWVLVCSDGLWNYRSAASELGQLVTETAARVGPEPLAVAGALCDWANEQGGHDNITVALLRVGSRRDTP